MKAGLVALAGAVLASMAGEASASVVARISLASQRMEVIVDGNAVHRWPISSGRAGHATPTGSFTPYHLSRDHKSSKYDDAPMPFAVFFKGDYAIHGTMAIGNLGRRASHGCVRLSPANARVFFDLVQKHGLSASKVVITDDATPAAVAERRAPQKVASARPAMQPPRPPSTAHHAHTSPRPIAVRAAMPMAVMPVVYAPPGYRPMAYPVRMMAAPGPGGRTVWVYEIR